MNDALLDHPPIVLRRRSLDEKLFVIAGVVAIIAAIAFATQAQFRFVGLPLGGIGLIVLLLGILMLIRPTTLELEPSGLHYSILGIVRF